jgi:hypothetical protein
VDFDKLEPGDGFPDGGRARERGGVETRTHTLHALHALPEMKTAQGMCQRSAVDTMGLTFAGIQAVTGRPAVSEVFCFRGSAESSSDRQKRLLGRVSVPGLTGGRLNFGWTVPVASTRRRPERRPSADAD